jgi:hypothetical protein
MNCRSLLKKALFLLRGISPATIDAADTDNIEWNLAEHRRALERATASTQNGSMANGKLRESIQRARTSSFAEFAAVRNRLNI